MKKNRDLDIGSWPDIVRKMYLTMKICVCMLILDCQRYLPGRILRSA